MNRWIVLLLVGLAIILLVSPGIIGRLAENNIDQGLSQVDLENENLSITAESFQRGWFTSEGRHRVSFDSGRLLGGIQSADSAPTGSPALIFETRLDHGLVPLGSLQRDSGSLSPSLASAVSTVAMDRGDGEIIDLPATIYGSIGLSGGSTAQLLVEAGSDSYGNAHTEWQGADLTYEVSGDGLARSLKGTIAPLTVSSWDIETRVGRTIIDSEQSRRRHPVGEGFIDLSLESFDVQMPGDDNTTVGPLVVHLENRITGDDTVAGGGRVEVVASQPSRFRTLDLDTTFNFADLDADGLRLIMDAAQVLSLSGTVAGMQERLLAEAQMDEGTSRLLTRGGTLKIDSATLTLPEGQALLSMTVELDESGRPMSPSDLPGLLLKTRGDLHAEVADELFEELMVMNPELRGLVAAGYLRKTASGYEVDIELDGGKLIINGAPLNLTSLITQ